MFRRKIYSEILKLKEESEGTSVLLIEGARRVGKSTVVEEFAINEDKDYVIIDFSIVEQELKDNFENIGNMDAFFERDIIYTKDLEWKDSILFMPIYMTMCL